MTPPSTRVEVRRAASRDLTESDWLTSRHSFSFGPHYDPANTSFGPLVAHNEEVVRADSGFDPHPHADLEIVTWVLSGSLVHQDSRGNSGVVYPGLAQRMSAGSGILHSEKNDARRVLGGPEQDEPVHYLQMWVLPDEPGARPSYAQRDVDDELRRGELVTVASGLVRHRERAAISLGNRDAALHAARLARGGAISLPDAPYLHLFVAGGDVELEGVGDLHQGDAVRITGAGGQRVAARTEAEVLVWEMHRAVGQ